MKLKGKLLDERIEQELQLMLRDGFDKAPISATTLHSRLTEKRVITGGLSTLSNSKRKALINMYKANQLDSTYKDDTVKDSFAASRTVDGYKQLNEKLKKENAQLKEQLRMNTETLFKILRAVESSGIQVENIAPEFMVSQIDELISPENDEFSIKRNFEW